MRECFSGAPALFGDQVPLRNPHARLRRQLPGAMVKRSRAVTHTESRCILFWKRVVPAKPMLCRRATHLPPISRVSRSATLLAAVLLLSQPVAALATPGDGGVSSDTTTAAAPPPPTGCSPCSGNPQATLRLRRMLFAGAAQQQLTFTTPAAGSLAVTLNAKAPLAPAIRTWDLGAAVAGTPNQLTWDGLGDDGRPAADDSYRFTAILTQPDGTTQSYPLGGSFTFLRNFFPVRGAHQFGTEINRFGATRTGHRHQGQDVLAACGTPLVAARGGTVKQVAFQAAAGNYLVISGAGSDTDFVYAHLRSPARVKVGQRVVTGQRLSEVGDTGDAVGCHLHFEMWSGPGWYTGGKPYDPLSRLLTWDNQTGGDRDTTRKRR